MNVPTSCVGSIGVAIPMIRVSKFVSVIRTSTGFVNPGIFVRPFRDRVFVEGVVIQSNPAVRLGSVTNSGPSAHVVTLLADTPTLTGASPHFR